MPILDSTHYPQIRTALDLSLDEMSLPDDVIEQDIYLGRAEMDVTTIYADAETFTGDNLLRIKRAVILFTAAYLAPAVVQIVSSSGHASDSSFSQRPKDMQARAVELRSQAQVELGNVVDQDADDAITLSPTTIVTVVQGKRGWWTGRNWIS